MLDCGRIRPAMASQQILRRLGARRSSVAALSALSGSCKPLIDAGSIRAVSSLTSGTQPSGSKPSAAADPQPQQLAGTRKPRQQHVAARKMSSAALPQAADSESENEDSDFISLPDRIGFIGAGQMGEALLRGFTASGVSSADRLSASVRSAERQQRMTSLGVRVFKDALKGGAQELAANNDIIVLGVKPVYMQPILKALKPFIEDRHLIVSIAAGLKIHYFESRLPEGARVVRVMPNTPCLIGQAASAYVMGAHSTEADKEKVDALMSSVGMAVCVDEHMIDAVTGLSGSGPAYVFQMLEAMADGAVAAGLTRDKAQALAAQTCIGAAKMVFESSGDGTMTHPGVLKDRVTSPAGTTITGLSELETSGVRGAYIRAIKAAANRSRELSATD